MILDRWCQTSLNHISYGILGDSAGFFLKKKNQFGKSGKSGGHGRISDIEDWIIIPALLSNQ
jgi:hypothetical protein